MKAVKKTETKVTVTMTGTEADVIALFIRYPDRSIACSEATGYIKDQWPHVWELLKAVAKAEEK